MLAHIWGHPQVLGKGGRSLGSFQLLTGELTEVYREKSALVPQSRQAPLSPEQGMWIVINGDIDPEKLWNWGQQAQRRSSVRLRADMGNVVKYRIIEARGSVKSEGHGVISCPSTAPSCTYTQSICCFIFFFCSIFKYKQLTKDRQIFEENHQHKIEKLKQIGN